MTKAPSQCRIKITNILDITYIRFATRVSLVRRLLIGISARHYPIYCLQWQPEKISFVWNPVLAVDHSPDAIRVAQYIANFFMVQARQNGQRFKTRQEEEANLILHRNPVYIGHIVESPYEQIYLFKNANGTDFGKDDPERFP